MGGGVREGRESPGKTKSVSKDPDLAYLGLGISETRGDMRKQVERDDGDKQVGVTGGLWSWKSLGDFDLCVEQWGIIKRALSRQER